MEILNTVYGGALPDKFYIITFIVMIVAFIITISGIFDDCDATCFIGFIGVFIALGAIVAGSIYDITHKSEKIDYYEVTISDDVKLTEFNKKYKIIDKRGELYKVRER